jgi:DNA-binding transcriptional MerR regulator
MNLTEYVTVSEVALRAGVSGAAVRKWEERGLLPSVRIANGTRLFAPADVEHLIAERSARSDQGKRRVS